MNLLAFKRRNLQEKNIVITAGSSVRNNQTITNVTNDGVLTYGGRNTYFIVTLYFSKPLRKFTVNFGTGSSTVYSVYYRDNTYIGCTSENPYVKTLTFSRGFNKMLLCIHKSYKNSTNIKNSRGKLIWSAKDENFPY